MSSIPEKHGMLADGIVGLLGLIHTDVKEIREKLTEIEVRQAEGDAKLTAHVAREEEEIKEIAQGLKASVPDGDLDAHRRAHEAWITEKNDRASLYRSVTEKIVTGGTLAMLGGIVTAVWFWVKEHVK